MGPRLHERVREYRKNHGITQAWLAKQIKMSPKTLNGIEKGRQRLTADIFELICLNGFRVNPAIFFGNGCLETKNEATGTTGD